MASMGAKAGLNAVTLVAVGALFLLLAPFGWGQCQDQACVWNGPGNCFQCGGSAGFGCDEASCAKCTTTRCPPSAPYAQAGISAAQLAAVCRGDLTGVARGGAIVARTGSETTEATREAVLVRRSSPYQIRLTIAAQPPPAAPLSILRVVHTNQDLFASGVLADAASVALRSYRIGWITVDGAGKARVALGRLTAVAAPSGKLEAIPAQGLTPLSLGTDTRLILFFAASANFSHGRGWQAAIPNLMHQAQTLAAAYRGKQ